MAAVYTVAMRLKRGFTMVELIIVITIVVVLSFLFFTSYTRAKARSKLSRTTTELTQIASALNQYAQDNGGYPADTSRSVPPGLEKYLQGGVWPTSAWPNGVFDWDNWVVNGQQIYQISYRLCDLNDPISDCSDPILFPNFVRNSSIFYCVSGPCVPHESTPTVPGYCVNCKPKEQNYTP